MHDINYFLYWQVDQLCAQPIHDTMMQKVLVPEKRETGAKWELRVKDRETHIFQVLHSILLELQTGLRLKEGSE